MTTNDDEERRLRDQQSAAGRARWTKATPEAAQSARAAAAHAINSPAGLARRLATKWPTLDADEQRAVAEALGPVWRAAYREGRGLPIEIRMNQPAPAGP